MLAIWPHVTITWLAVLSTMHFTRVSVLDDDDEVGVQDNLVVTATQTSSLCTVCIGWQIIPATGLDKQVSIRQVISKRCYLHASEP
jgi:hypothetical protein